MVKDEHTNAEINRNRIPKTGLFIFADIVLFDVMQDFVFLPKSEAFLLSSSLVILAIYWLPPVPCEAYLKWIARWMFVTVGVYLAALKLPMLLSRWLPFPVAIGLPILLFSLAYYWSYLKLKGQLPSD